MSNSSSSSSNGVGFFGLLTIVLITLKLLHVITLSWWLVLLPAYGVFALFLLLIVGCLIVAVIAKPKSKIARRFTP